MKTPRVALPHPRGISPRSLLLLGVPIRWRLTLFYAALSATILLLLGFVLYRQMDSFLLDSTAARLQAQAQPALDKYLAGRIYVTTATPANSFIVPAPPSAGRRPPDSSVPIAGSSTGEVGTPAPGQIVEGPSVRAIELDLPPDILWKMAPARSAAQDIAVDLNTRDTSAVVLDPYGEVIASAPPPKGVPPPSPEPRTVRRAAREDTEITYTTRSPTDGGRVLVTLMPLRRATDNAVIGVLQLTTSLQPADDLLHRLRLLLLVGLGGALGLCVVLGVPLTRAALRPLDRLVATTEQIAGNDLAARSSLPHGRDEIGRLASAFDRMLARLQASFQAQRQFVADAAHELRTPLTAISGLIELLLLGADNEDRAARRRTLVTVDRDLTRLTRLVNDLLDLSRHDLAAGRERRPVNLDALVADIHGQCAVLAPDREVLLERPAEPITALGDADHLRQVLLNLADNARRHTPPGGRITFGIGRAGGGAIVTVADTGSGIAPDDLPRIFERFYRGDRARARASGGAGLGLAIARAIAEAHGGSLTAASTLGRGATFTLRLPALDRLQTAADPSVKA